MLTPEELEHVSDDIVNLYSDIENELMRDIIKRMLETGEISSTSELRIKTVQELGKNYDDLLKVIARYTSKSENCIRRTFEDACIKSLEFDDKIYKVAGLTPIPLNQSPSMLQILNATIEKTNIQFNNLTLTMVDSAQKVFVDNLNKAYLKTITGAFSYNESVKQAIDELSRNGLYIEYPSGRKDCIDVAVKRAVRTGVVQTSGMLQEIRAKEMGCEYYEISAHVGARNVGEGYCNHERWQGKVFKIKGSTNEYPNFKSSTGYGKIQGLCGINCRHAFFPFFPGISKRTYTDEELKDISNQTVMYNGNKIKKYQAEQMQRKAERDIRKTKRNISLCEEALKTSNDKVLTKELSNELVSERQILIKQVKELENFKLQTKDTIDEFFFNKKKNKSENIERIDITKEFNSTIIDAFDNGRIRNIALSTPISKITVGGNRSYHRKGVLNFSDKWVKKDFYEKMKEIRHEVGHAIDYNNGYISKELIKAIELDKKIISNNINELKNCIRTEEYYNYSELSDIISGMTMNQVQGFFFHRNEYWKISGKLEKEIFANLIAIAGSDDIKYLEIVNKYIPNTLIEFSNIIGRL